MSAKKRTSKSTAVVPVEKRAIAALGLQHREKDLVALAAKTAHIVTITNDDGYRQVDSARKTLKRERLAIQKIGDETIDEAKRVVKLAGAELTRLVGIAESEEDRLKALQDARDTEIEAERQKAIDAEMARQAALQERIAELRGNQLLLSTSGSALLAQHISDLERIAVDESFEECREQAEATKSAGLSRLRELHTAAIAHEAEQERIALERAELARLRAEAAQRAKDEAERERQAKAAREAEERRHAEQLRRQAEESQREQNERQRLIDEENDRIRAANEAEQQRLAAERAEVERQQEELRKAREPAVVPTPEPERLAIEPNAPAHTPSGFVTLAARKPSREEIIDALCDEFGLDERQVVAALSEIDWRASLAEAA